MGNNDLKLTLNQYIVTPKLHKIFQQTDGCVMPKYLHILVVRGCFGNLLVIVWVLLKDPSGGFNHCRENPRGRILKSNHRFG